MADKRVIEEPSSTELYSDDWFLKDSATNGTTKILASKLKELFCGDYIADEWVAGETYTNGAIVSHEGKLYYNKSGGTLVHTTFNSNSWLEVKIDELLEKVIGSVGEKWRLVDTYHYDDLVVYGGRLYRCIKNASTQGTWVSNEWIEANAAYYFKKVREYIARYGFVPSGEAISSPYNKGDLILYRAPGDTTNNLYMRLNDTEYGDTTWIPENWLNVGNIGGALSKIYDDMEESSCDVQIKEQSIIDENKVADLTSLAMVGSASGAIATFDDGSALPMPSLEVAIEPQQDLHGYDAPWVGGSGKNKANPDLLLNGYTNPSNRKYDDTTMAKTQFVKTEGLSTITISAANGNRCYVCYYNDLPNVGDEALTNVTQVATSLPQTITVDSSYTYVAIQVCYNPSGANVSNVQVESGTTVTSFAPYSNICPISGHTEANVSVSGVNVWDEDYELGRIDGNTGQNISSNDRLRSKGYILVKPNTIYSIVIPQYGIWVYPYKLDKTYKGTRYNRTNGQTFKVPNDCYYLRFEVYADYGTTYNNDISINYPSTDTEYHAYNGQTYTIDLDGTRYGCTLDVVSGVMTVDRVNVDMGDLNWTYQALSGDRNGFTVSISDLKEATSGSDLLPAISSCYKPVRYNDTWANGVMSYFYPTGKTIIVINNDYTDATDFKTAMNGVQLVYELATPITIQLTPTQVKSLLGTNNVWADTGNVFDAEYIRDATTIINSLIARIEALENQ